MRKKYSRVFVHRLRSGGPLRAFRPAVNALAVLYSAWRGKAFCAPISATLALTYRCNQRCVMCNFPQRVRKGVEKMSAARAEEIIEELSRMGVYGVSFYGGEPLLRDDIVELTAFAHNAGLTVHIATNGMLLTKTAARALIEAGVDLITLSMDGATPEAHDRQRGVPGAFDRLRSAVRNVLSARRELSRSCHCALAATLTDHNVEDVAGIVRNARDLGADTLSVFEAQDLHDLSQPLAAEKISSLLHANERLREEKRSSPGLIDNSEPYLDFCRRLFSGEKPYIKCFAPYTDIFIDAYEDVYTCNYFFGMAHPIGNLRGGSVREFWRSDGYRAARRKLIGCTVCNYMCHRELSLLLNKLYLPALWYNARFRVPRC